MKAARCGPARSALLYDYRGRKRVMNIRRGQALEGPVISAASWDSVVTLVSVPPKTTTMDFVAELVLLGRVFLSQ